EQAYGEALAENPGAFSEPFRRRFAGVTRHSAEDYAAAQEFRERFRKTVADVLSRCDVLAAPTSTVAAALIAEQPGDHDVERRKNCCIFNFTGQPARSRRQPWPSGGRTAGRHDVGGGDVRRRNGIPLCAFVRSRYILASTAPRSRLSGTLHPHFAGANTYT
ncbi:MAG TPA: hypothetical protein EYP98_04560, partial [Planctomycetes bacterium]|nr:hypothetical protein [Planctomycetota bacterium]